MGWLFTRGATVKDIVKERLKGGSYTSGRLAGCRQVLLDHALVGGNLWIAWGIVRPDGTEVDRFIELDLIRSDREFGAGYKDMEESMGPVEVNCPLRLLDLVPEPKDSQYAKDWRGRVREHHAARRKQETLRKGLKAGDKLKLAPGWTLESVTILEHAARGFLVIGNDGGLYRMSTRHLAGATPLTA